MLNDRKPCAMRGRQMIKQERSEYGKQIRKEYGGELHPPRANIQQFEIRKDGIANTITTVTKDYLTIGKWEKNMVDENKKEPCIDDYLFKDYGVFKLSVRECGRLQGLTDADISKMMAVNSKTQCYKQIGNAITVPVLMALFSQLNIQDIKPWNDRTEDERQALVEVTRDYVSTYSD